jgi:dienelactone hydrolase
MSTSPSWRARLASAASALVLALGLAASGVAAPAPAVAVDNPYERGPAPTRVSIEAQRGPYATSSTSVSRLVGGFGGGTIYYPTTRADGTFGAVAVAPGYTASASSVAWLGPRIASQGFVVIVFDTSSRYDQPASRGDQLLAALDYVTQRSSVRDRVDASRLAVMGHSMGGGGSLEAAKDRPGLKAAIPMTPWNLDKTWGEITTPTLLIGADGDSVAPTGSHAEPFYESLPRTLPKAYLELRNASHFAPNTSDTEIAAYSISWLKRFVDSDTRYSQFLCPAPAADLQIAEYRATCPY